MKIKMKLNSLKWNSIPILTLTPLHDNVECPLSTIVTYYVVYTRRISRSNVIRRGLSPFAFFSSMGFCSTERTLSWVPFGRSSGLLTQELFNWILSLGFPYYLYRSIPNEPILAQEDDLFAGEEKLSTFVILVSSMKSRHVQFFFLN